MVEVRTLDDTLSRRVGLGIGLAAAAVALAACGSSSSGGSTAVAGGQQSASSTGSGAASGSSDSAATTFSVANVAGVGPVVVDGRGRTVYMLTKPGQKNLPCTDGTGCTTEWPDLSLPAGTTSATAGHGLSASLLGTKKANGEIYAAYNGWLLYEYAGDSAPGQAHGQGVNSYGGVWHTLNAAGTPVTTPASSPGSSGSSSGGYGGGYGSG